MMNAVEQVQIPEKLFYRINEVSTITQIKPYVLRYWETEFPTLGPEKDENDQRRYRRSDIDLIMEIKRLLYTEKFTIAGARKQLRSKPERPVESEIVQQVETVAQTGPVQVEMVAESSAVISPVAPSRRRVNPEQAEQLKTSLNDLRRDVNDLCALLG